MRVALLIPLPALLASLACSSPQSSTTLAPGASSAALAACTMCHGDPVNGNAAPPYSVKGATATTDRAVGAHQKHLHDGNVRSALACSDCHVVPTSTDAPGHIDARTAELVWGNLARAGGVTPSFAVSADGTGLTCTTYCHGGSFAASNGANHAPSWTKVDGTQAGCGTCHGIPPPAPHAAVSGGLTSCSSCHPGTIRPDGTIDLAGGLHVDGTVEIGGGACTSCHGDSARTPAAIAAAPPRGTQGETLTSSRAVGAHQAHLVAGHVHAPIACTECHVVPTSTASHPSGAAELSFGSLATSGGAQPSWNGTSCATTYCHGGTLGAGGAATQPVWTLVDGSQRQCGSCHGAPPPTSSGHPSVGGALTGCAGCHPATVKADGTIDLAGGKHLNGTVDVAVAGAGCTSCHGGTLSGGTGATGANPVAAAPPKDTAGLSTSTAVGAHARHLLGGTIRGAVQCSDCHTVPGDTTHATQPLDLTWGTLARTSGVTPSWTPATVTCTNYCHGATLPGGSNTSPAWDAGPSQAACGSCHAIPPPASSGHPDVGSDPTVCAGCHPATVKADGTIDVAGGKHVDGILELAGGGTGCTSCHGGTLSGGTGATGANPLEAAPPRDTAGQTATTSPGVGAHARHLLGGALRTAMQCSDCHTVPADTAHSGQPLDLTWGVLARTASVTPSWNATTLTCTNYCHGASLSGGSDKTPIWTQGSSQAACGTCHGLPPGNGHHSTHQSRGIGCGTCHGTAYSSSAVDTALHVNGLKDIRAGATPGWNATSRSCSNSCHGSENW